MSTIGLDKPYYAKITEDEQGNETYGPPILLAKAIQADLAIELAEAILYADDTAAEVVKEFKKGTLSLAIDDLSSVVASDLTGARRWRSRGYWFQSKESKRTLQIFLALQGQVWHTGD